MAIDRRNGQILPFQTLSTRSKVEKELSSPSSSSASNLFLSSPRQDPSPLPAPSSATLSTDVNISSFGKEECDVCVFIFDVMYMNGNSLVDLPLDRRIAKMDDVSIRALTNAYDIYVVVTPLYWFICGSPSSTTP